MNFKSLLFRIYANEVGQKSQWEKYLPLVEYDYNNIIHTSTLGKAPLENFEGCPKIPLILRTKEQMFTAN